MLRLVLILALSLGVATQAEVNEEFIETLYKDGGVKFIAMNPSGTHALAIYEDRWSHYIDVYNLAARTGKNIALMDHGYTGDDKVMWIDNDSILVHTHRSALTHATVHHLSYLANGEVELSKTLSFELKPGGVASTLLRQEDEVLYFVNNRYEDHFYRLNFGQKINKRKLFNRSNRLDVDIRNISDWAFDANNNLRFIETQNDEAFTSYYRESMEAEWRQVGQLNADSARNYYAINSADQLITVEKENEDRRVVAYYDPNTMTKVKTAYSHPHYDTLNPLFDESRELIGATIINQGVSEQVFIDDKYASLKEKIQAKHNFSRFYIVDSNLDKTRFLILASKNGYHTKYYDYEVESDRLKLTKDKSPWLKSLGFGKTESIELESKHGHRIEAYLTLPTDTVGDVPLIVQPHGGPFGVRDYKFESGAAVLAEHGYAVLRVNFRGSSGFGKRFLESGKGGFGTIIESDIMEVLEHSMNSFPIAQDRICVVGASYGGYSMGSLLASHPDKFKCGISFAGVFDLNLQINEAKRFARYKEGLEKFFKEYIVDLEGNPNLQKERSPVFHADKIQAPVLLLHGVQDDVVDVEQSQRFHYFLQKAGKSSELVELPEQGHGQRTISQLKDYYRHIIPFLQEHL